MKLSEVDRSKLAPMMKHYVSIKDNYMDVILFYRLGDFYEMFFDDAITASHELELTLTGRNAGLDERVPMCGVPHHAVDVYIDKLVKKGYKVAICEQMEDPKNAHGIVKRSVTEVISSGTVISANSLDEKLNNFVGSVYDFEYCYVIVYTDITTGEVYAKIINHDNNILINDIISFDLKEIIVNSIFDSKLIKLLKEQYKLTVTVSDSLITDDTFKSCYEHINDVRYITAIKHLFYYLSNVQMRNLTHLQKVVILLNEDFLKMDIHTKRNLELTENLRLKDKNYSLLWLLDNTKTAMGGRKLRQWIDNPLVDKHLILQRYNVIDKLMKEFILSEDLRRNLYDVYDLERLSGRISLGNANGRDLIQLKKSLKILPVIKDMLKSIDFYYELDDLNDLYELLECSLYEDPPIGIKDGYLIKDGYSSELDELKSLRSGGKDFISNFEIMEREKTGIKNLKVGFNKVFGYYIEVTKSNLDLITDDMGYIRKQTLANCERFITNSLKEKEDLILGAEERIINLEYELFIGIRDKCKEFISRIQNSSKVLSEIDVLQSFALVSEKYNYVRPNLNDDNIVNLIDSRHPVVERVIKDEYVPNDIIMDKDVSTFLITGPNMAGKSTFMRQLGIIAIMAQIGCYVPASSANLPIFDKIFTRIGASDDLVSGESTFMVEMIEATNAINNATDKSLILFDELGRGTATYDGMSLAQSILEYVHDKIGCKTLFSTHYHELVSLEKNLPHLKNKHVSATEEEGELIFLHKVKDGSVDKSYGINVAKLAGLPDDVISRANEILTNYENTNKNSSNNHSVVVQQSLALDYSSKSVVEDELKKANILEMTPINALNFLYELKEKMNNKN